MKEIIRFLCIIAAFVAIVYFMEIDNKRDIFFGGFIGITAAFLVFFLIRKIRKK